MHNNYAIIYLGAKKDSEGRILEHDFHVTGYKGHEWDTLLFGLDPFTGKIVMVSKEFHNYLTGEQQGRFAALAWLMLHC